MYEHFENFCSECGAPTIAGCKHVYRLEIDPERKAVGPLHCEVKEFTPIYFFK